MGLFKSIVNAALPGAALTSKLATGKSLGSHAEGFLGLNKDAPQFNPDLREIRGDIQKVRDLRDKDIEDVRKSAQITLDQVGLDRARAFGDIQAGEMGRFAALQDALARGGGAGSGARERLAGQLGRESALSRQRASSDFGRLTSDITAQDIAAQEALKNQALFQTPQLSAIPLEIQTQASAANMRARALADAAKGKKMGAIGALGGAALGFGLGGPLGASVGSSLGGGLFSAFG